MIIVLGVVLGAIYGVFFLLRRATRGVVGESSLIEVIGSQQIPGGKSVHLVGIGSQIYIVGAADNGVNLIDKIEDQETIDEIRLRISQSNSRPRQSFSEVMAGILPAFGLGGSASSKNVLQRQRERLRRLG